MQASGHPEKPSISDTFKTLETSAKGLSSREAHARLAKYGYNEIAKRKKSMLVAFLAFFWGPIPWMIEAASVLSAILTHWIDLAIIFSLLIINACLGFWQEYKADRAIEFLMKRLALSARVLRDGRWASIPARELVPGDIVRVRLGDIIPADITLSEGSYLLLDESALTGESLPAEKRAGDTTYSGAIVRQGEMDAVVTATGERTYFGKTAKLVEEAKNQSHFQKAVMQIGDYLIVLALVLVSIVLILSLIRGENFLVTLQFALILLVASIPVAMPAVLSVTMAVGAVALAGKDAIVTKLETIEELAGMDTLCVDKTGTITQNKLAVSEIRSFGEFSDQDVLLFASIASREEDQDPLEAAIFAKAKVAHVTSKGYKILKYVPFDPVSKRTEALASDPKSKRRITVTKGAPQVIAALTKDKTTAKKAMALVEDFASRGYRALAVAKAESGGAMVLVGMLGLYDPPRTDSKKTLAAAEAMGMSVKMITGDHIAIAKEICSEVGIGGNILPASALKKTPVSVARIEHADAFAEVFPENKFNIVQALQRHGHIVGMTGDGVNDAPALKEANVGIAVSGATDAARSAADIVLTAPGLTVIIDAIRQSRKIFERMTSYATYRIAETIRVLLFLTLAILLFKIYPLNAIMLVFLALLNDFPIMMIAYDNAPVAEKPVSWRMRRVLGTATLLGGVGLVESFSVFLIALFILKLPFATLQTLMFLKLAVSGHMTIYLARTKKKHFWERPLPSSRLFFTTEITQVAATLFVASGILMAPISWALVGFVWGWALMFFVIADVAKHIYLNRKGKRGQ